MSKEAVMAALRRAAEDIHFYRQLSEDYDLALRGYDLTPEEILRVGTGDLNWIQGHTDTKVDQRVLNKVFIPLLSREQWAPG